MRKAIVTVGLGWGDEGKGATVDALVRKFGADLVVRYSGGSQCGHNVQLDNGVRFTFSQFGAGTFAGAKTYLGPNMIIRPDALAREAAALEKLHVNPYAMLYIDRCCLVSTFYNSRLNRLKELSRGARKHGSCGHGIGEARRYWLEYGSDAVKVADLQFRHVLRDKLELQRQRTLSEISKLREYYLIDGEILDDIVSVPVSYLVDELLEYSRCLTDRMINCCPTGNIVVFEGAQGVLLDEWHGFPPYNTWSTVTSLHAKDILRGFLPNETIMLGVTRTYSTRHGAGPFPTENKSFGELLGEDPGNPDNQWQDSLRYGYLDLVLLEYATNCSPIDALVVNHVDEVRPGWQVCTNHVVIDYCSPDVIGITRAYHADERVQRLKCEQLERCSSKCVPVDTAELLHMLGQIAPVAITSYGPTAEARVFHAGVPI